MNQYYHYYFIELSSFPSLDWIFHVKSLVHFDTLHQKFE